MKKATEDLIDAITNIKPATVPTANRAGEPNGPPRGSFCVLDDNYLGFADIKSPQTISNLRENPNRQIIGLAAILRRRWSVWRTAGQILTSGELYDHVCREYADRGNVKHRVQVLVKGGLRFRKGPWGLTVGKTWSQRCQLRLIAIL